MDTQNTQQTGFDEQTPLAERESIGGLECTRCGDRFVGIQRREDGTPMWVPCSCPAPCETCDPEEAVEQGFGCTCGWLPFLFVRLTREEWERMVEEGHTLAIRRLEEAPDA